MNGIPRFESESSLDPPRGSYRATAGFSASGAADGLSRKGGPRQRRED